MATVPSPRTWVTGEVVTAAEMNTEIRDTENFLIGGAAGRRPKLYAARAGAVQSVPNSVETAVFGDTVLYDTDSGYNSGTGVYTCQTSGFWSIQMASQWATSNATGFRGVHIVTNGYGSWNWTTGAIDSSGRCSVSMQIQNSSAVQITYNVYQTSGVALNLGGPATACFVSAAWICA